MRRKAGYRTRNLGKLLFFGSQGQWDVVGDTFIEFSYFTHVTTLIYMIDRKSVV